MKGVKGVLKMTFLQHLYFKILDRYKTCVCVYALIQVDFSVRVSAVRSIVHSEAVLSVSSSVLPVSLCWDFGDASPLLNTSVTTVQHKYGLPGHYRVKVVATAAHRETSGMTDVRLELPPRLELHCPSLLLANHSLEEAVTLVNWGGVGVAVVWRIRKEGVEVAQGMSHMNRR